MADTPMVDLSREIRANMELERQGSVMAESRGAMPKVTGNPTIDSFLQTIATMLQKANPMDFMGGPGQAVIGATGNKHLLSLLEALRGKAPKLVQKAEGLKEMVQPYLVPRETMPYADSLGVFRKSTTLPKGEMYIRGGRPQGEQVDTLGHELRHFLNAFDPAIQGKNPEHALETAQQLSGMMPPAQKKAMQSYLPSTQMMPTITQRLKAQNPAQASHAGLAYDESLAYLTEALMQGNQGGDPMLSSIASALGQGLR